MFRIQIVSIIFILLSLTSAKILDLSDLDTTLVSESLFSSLYNQSVEWGIYKPDLYLGVKNRQENPLSFGMFWYSIDPNNQTALPNTTYAYVMDQGITAYYQFNDGTSASRQLITDEHRQMQYTVEYQKELEQKDELPNEYISRWTARITIKEYQGEIKGYPVFFAAKEGKIKAEEGYFKVSNNVKNNFYKLQHAVDPVNNIYEIIEIGNDQQIDSESMLGIQVEDDMTWQLDKLWTKNYQSYITQHGLIDTTTPNIIMIKPTKTIDGLQIVVRYSKQKFASESAADSYSEIMERDSAEVKNNIDAKMIQAEQKFKDRYLSVFGEGYKDFLKTMPDALMFGHETLSQLLGGIGYFYGPIRIKDETDPEGKKWFYDNPAGLFTATPSRPYFPRGFLWDEGFHSQLTCQWSKFLCMDIISHWFNSIKENGWIPREQMRGKQAESNLDWELVEDPKAGNPPSFMFVLQYLLTSLETKQDQKVVDFLTNIYPRVELWFNWFNTTLANQGSNLIGTYMWQDVYKGGALSSGLDDYPRGYREAQKGNVHSDLQMWMISFSKFMAQFIDDIEGIIHKRISQKTSDDYRELVSLATQQFRTWCYNPENGLYTDRIFYEDNPLPVTETYQTKYDEQFLQESRQLQTSQLRKYKHSNYFSPHQGIINMFPVAFNMFQGNSDRLEDTLMFAADPETIFSPFGLRGVSKRDINYFPGTGYWTGPIWISVNYLVLRGLSKYYMEYIPTNPIGEDGSIKTPKDLYLQLRQNLVQTVYDNWEPQHLFYENFNDVTGKGQFSHPFSGWTSLILLVMNEKYI